MNIGAQGKRIADNNTGGAMANHMVQTPRLVTIINRDREDLPSEDDDEPDGLDDLVIYRG